MALTAEIDLTTGRIEISETNPQLLKTWLGGRGLGAYLLYKLVPTHVGAFDPENYMIFTSGIYNGTAWPTSSRYHVTFKSPETDAYGYANAGGHFGPELRRAGFDALVISGRAKEPVFVRVVDREISILPARELWGKTTTLTEEILTRELGGRVASIGVAGENRVRLAAIINDGGRAAARSGPGAVMGSKNLKAVHIVASDKRGTSAPGLAQLVKQTSTKLLSDPHSEGLRNNSTLFLMSIKNMSGDLPAMNHQLAQVPFIQTVNDKAFSAYWTKRKGCAACPLRCSRESVVANGEYASHIEGPEYETTDSFGPMVWNANPEVVIAANRLCNEFGLDTIGAGVTIAFAMECHQRGLLDDDEFTLEWGDPKTILGLVEAIARRRGLGDLLAEGVKRAAEKIGRGSEAYAMHVKGVEMPRQEPRIAKAFGLGHGTSNRGADHLYALPTISLAGNWDAARKIFPEEMVPTMMDGADETYKPDEVVYGEHFSAVVDSLGLCKFSTSETYTVMPDELAEGLRILGFETSGAGLLEIGERIVNLERLYNLRHGMSRKDDMLPRRFSEEPVEIYAFTPSDDPENATRSEKPVTVGILKDFDAMLDRYYDLRGWDRDGRPTSKTLERLGLTDLARE